MPNPPEIVQQYGAAVTVGGLYWRADRGLLEVRGKDRAAWLNNLVTNVVKTLQPGEGNYAFATNVKGRVVFDLNILVLEDCLWLDVDCRQTEAALRHFERYIITEDAQVRDISATVERGAFLGPRAAEAAARWGLGHLPAMSQLQHVAGRVGESEARFIRHDFVGLKGVEILMGGEGRLAARTVVEAVADEFQLARLSDATIQILRMEAGIPRSVDDIDEDVVPPETGQIERGISYHKGCYLGQEVIERMRSHGVLARKLVGLQMEGDIVVEREAQIFSDSNAVGRVTSSCVSEALRGVLCLGYVKTASSKPGATVRVEYQGTNRLGHVVALPARR